MKKQAKQAGIVGAMLTALVLGIMILLAWQQHILPDIGHMVIP